MSILTDTTSRLLTNPNLINFWKNTAIFSTAFLAGGIASWSLKACVSTAARKTSLGKVKNWNHIGQVTALITTIVAGSTLATRALRSHNITTLAPALALPQIARLAAICIPVSVALSLLSWFKNNPYGRFASASEKQSAKYLAITASISLLLPISAVSTNLLGNKYLIPCIATVGGIYSAATIR